MGVLFALVYFAISGLIYFLPTVVARSRGNSSALPIFLVNLLLGWTVIGWIIALVWSLTLAPAHKIQASAA